MLQFLPASFADLEVKNGDHEVDEKIFLYGPKSSNMLPLEEFIAQTFGRGAPKVLIKMVSEATTSFKPL